MRKLLFLFALLLSVAAVLARDKKEKTDNDSKYHAAETFGHCRLCFSYDDFVNDVWTDCDRLNITHMTRCSYMFSTNEIQINTDDKLLRDSVKKHVFMIEVGGKMFVNLRHKRLDKPFASNYVRAYRMDSTKVFFGV